jgi:hypothetical protein
METWLAGALGTVSGKRPGLAPSGPSLSMPTKNSSVWDVLPYPVPIITPIAGADSGVISRAASFKASMLPATASRETRLIRRYFSGGMKSLGLKSRASAPR